MVRPAHQVRKWQWCMVIGGGTEVVVGTEDEDEDASGDEGVTKGGRSNSGDK